MSYHFAQKKRAVMAPITTCELSIDEELAGQASNFTSRRFRVFRLQITSQVGFGSYSVEPFFRIFGTVLCFAGGESSHFLEE